jgi:hypothetical protein
MCQIAILLRLIALWETKAVGYLMLLGILKGKDNFIKGWSYGYSNLRGL